MEEYLVPAGFGREEFTEKRSRFIGSVWPVETEEEAQEIIGSMRKQFGDATHNCWAYIIRGGALRFSDDGEPGGTAGNPMMQVLQKEGLSNVLCVVTRYFGGILLGAGGLVRAYTKAAKLAVDAAGIAQKRVWCLLKMSMPYPWYDRVKLAAEDAGAILRNTDFGAEVEMDVLVALPERDRLTDAVKNMTAGQVIPEETGREYRAFPIKKEELQ